LNAPSDEPAPAGVSNRGRKEGDMVRLDDKLLLDACEISNGANVPYLKKMISAYEDAVDLHNRNCPRHEVYHRQSESRLRQYVRNCKEADIRIKTFDAIDLAWKATIKSIELTHEYKRLEKQLAEWESRTDFSRKELRYSQLEKREELFERA
jgi:hypothetical protein